MKKQNGITIISLILYIAVMLIVLVIMSSVISSFYDNVNGLNVNADKIIAFNKFNVYFLKEVKQYNNKVDTIKSEKNSSYILFTSGNSFLFNSDTNCVYYNNLKICENVKDIKFAYGKIVSEEDVEDKSIIKVTLDFENFSKTMNYKLENIY